MKLRTITRPIIGRHIAVALTLAAGSLSAASYLDTNGFTALWATTTNLNGSGVVVAQAEAITGGYPPSMYQWEVNPVTVGQPALPFSYIFLSSTNVFPNSLGAESGHADAVASYFYGLPSGEATNVAVVNQSFIDSGISIDIQQARDLEYDNYAAQFGTLFVSAVGNGGQVYCPATCYNGLGVAAFGTANSSVGPTLDNGRCKPDITAPADATSYSTPQVSGAATVLLQAALRGDGGSATKSAADLRTLKALLLNGAVKPAGWTNSSASPLDARYGAGLVNIFNSYTELAGGKHG